MRAICLLLVLASLTAAQLAQEFTIEGYLCQNDCDYSGGKNYLTCVSAVPGEYMTQEFNCSAPFNSSPCYSSNLHGALIQPSLCDYGNSSIVYDSALYTGAGVKTCCFSYAGGSTPPVPIQNPPNPPTCRGYSQTCQYRMRDCRFGYASSPTSPCQCTPGYQGDKCQYLCPRDYLGNILCCNPNATASMDDNGCKCKAPYWGQDCSQKGCLISELPAPASAELAFQVTDGNHDPLSFLARTNITLLQQDMVQYSCKKGTLVGGTIQLVCSSTGQWQNAYDSSQAVTAPICSSYNDKSEASLASPSICVLLAALAAGWWL